MRPTTRASQHPPRARPRAVGRRASREMLAASCSAVADDVVAAIVEGGTQLPRRVLGVDGRDDPQRGPARARRLPHAGQPGPHSRPAHPQRTGRRGQLPARARRGPQRRTTDALLAAFRIGARVVVARAVEWVPPTASPQTCSPTSPSWSSPTSTSCPRPRSPVTPTRPRPPAGSGSGCSSASRCSLLDGAPADEVTAAADSAAGRRPPR